MSAPVTPTPPALAGKGRIAERFAALRAAKKCGLVTYVTAGDPDASKSAEILKALDRAGADVLEIGVPFSEPLADGPVIQRASERALAGGMTLSRTLDLIASVRSSISAPVVLFTYANPVYRFGIDRFVARAVEAGVDGLLVLDLPIEEAGVLHEAAAAAGIDIIWLLSPTTTTERIRKAAESGRGFLYGISRLGVTGVRSEVAGGAGELASQNPPRDGSADCARLRPVAAGAHSAGGGDGRCGRGRQRAGGHDREARGIACARAGRDGRNLRAMVEGERASARVMSS